MASPIPVHLDGGADENASDFEEEPLFLPVTVAHGDGRRTDARTFD
jgi:hypothetical protein